MTTPQREGCCPECECPESCYFEGAAHVLGKCHWPTHKCHTPTPPVHEGGSEWERELEDKFGENGALISRRLNDRQLEAIKSFIAKVRQSAIEEDRAQILAALPQPKIVRAINNKIELWEVESWNAAIEAVRTAITNNREITK